MIDACPVTDNILADHFDGRRCAAVGAACEGRILRNELVVDNMDLESAPTRVEEGI
jgi:hypothetical protein